MVTLNCLSLIASISGTITDSTGAFLLQQTDFRYCSYTESSIVSPCNKPECSAMRFPRNTCFCCYIMEGISTKNCEIALLTGRQYYYSEVNSCMEVAVGLRVKLIFLAMLHVINAVISVAGICKTSPLIELTPNDTIKFSALSAKDKKQMKVESQDEFSEEEEEELLGDEAEEEERRKRIMNQISNDSVL